MEAELIHRGRGLADEDIPSKDGAVEGSRKIDEIEAPPAVASAPPAALEAERQKHQLRAHKFGVEYVEPKKEHALSRAELRTEIARQRARGHQGFATGLDLFSEEEAAKRDQRSQRFGVEAVGEGAPREPAEDEERRRRREERFGKASPPPPDGDADIMETDVLEARTDAQEGAALRPEAVHMHGTDQMSTRDCLAYFRGYGPSFVEWINDSSCNVVFEDAFSAKRALLALGSPEQGASPASPPHPQAAAPWYKGNPFAKGPLLLPLSLRIACTEDVKPASGVVSRNLWRAPSGPPPGAGRGSRRKRGRSSPQRGADALDADVGGLDEAAWGAEDDAAAPPEAEDAPEEGDASLVGAASSGGDLRDRMLRKGTSVETGEILGNAVAAPLPGEAPSDLRDILARRRKGDMKDRLGPRGLAARLGVLGGEAVSDGGGATGGGGEMGIRLGMGGVAPGRRTRATRTRAGTRNLGEGRRKGDAGVGEIQEKGLGVAGGFAPSLRPQGALKAHDESSDSDDDRRKRRK